MLQVIPNTKEAYQLLHEGSLALAEVEMNGIHVDVGYCRNKIKDLEGKIGHLNRKILRSPEVKKWQQKNRGRQFNIDSGPHLSEALFKLGGYKSTKKTASGGKYSTDEEALTALGIPLVDDIILCRQLKKVKNTYLGNFLREEVNGFIHPFFNLHIVRTYRSSSDSPNFQNIPNRIKHVQKMCRRAIIPRPDNRLKCVDYGGAEIRGATCYHKDPNMIEEIVNPERDMHRDMAIECYLLDKNEWMKETRYCGKNKFVFPQFYGDYWKNCAKNLWDAIDPMKLQTKSGIPLKEHLKSKGIHSFVQFEKHIQKVEKNFWGKRFKVYGQWKEDWVEQYYETGIVPMLSGFVCRGIMDRNDVINYPVQGFAFHWLLWSLIQLQKAFKHYKFKSKIIGQIHDEMVIDEDPKESDDITELCTDIMTKKVRQHWSNIIVPLEIEFEVTGIDKSWDTKEKILFKK